MPSRVKNIYLGNSEQVLFAGDTVYRIRYLDVHSTWIYPLTF